MSSASVSAQPVCIASTDCPKSHAHLLRLLEESGIFRVRRSKIIADFIFNCMGTSVVFAVAFVSVRDLKFLSQNLERYSRELQTLLGHGFRTIARMSRNSYGVMVVPPDDRPAFLEAFSREVSGGRLPPMFYVADSRAALEKMTRMVHFIAESRRQGTRELVQEERLTSVQSLESTMAPLMATGLLDAQSAAALLSAFGTIKDIASANSEKLMMLGLSEKAADTLASFFRNLSG